MAWIVSSSYLLLFIFTFSAQTSNGAILLSSLPNTLEVAASQLKANQVTSPNGTWYMSNEIIAGEDRLGVLWYLNSTFPAGTDASYKNVKVKLCYVPESQVGMPSRKTDDDLAKDKTCQFQFAERPYNASSNWSYFESTLDPRVPPASYFVRVYAYGSEGVEVAYGQNTDADVSYNRFEVISPGGNSWIDNQSGSKEKSTIDIATTCFSCALSLGKPVSGTAPAGTDESYKTVKVKLCYTPESQVNNPSRKTDDDLSKDKTCQFEITDRPYNASSNWQLVESTLDPSVPHASYFVRVYAYGAEGVEVAYGQNTNSDAGYNIFEVSGGSKSTLNIATIGFSALSVLSLVGFFLA